MENRERELIEELLDLKSIDEAKVWMSDDIKKRQLVSELEMYLKILDLHKPEVKYEVVWIF